MIRISQINMPLRHTDRDLLHKTAKILRIDSARIQKLTIIKKSIDARKKPELFLVYTVDVKVDGEEKLLQRQKGNQIQKAQDVTYRFPLPEGPREDDCHSPIIIGTGPAGLFCGYMLAKHGFRPILLERGKAVEERVADVAAEHRLRREHALARAEAGNFVLDVHRRVRFKRRRAHLAGGHVREGAAARAAAQGVIVALRLWNEGGAETRNGAIEAFLHEKCPGEWPEPRGGSFRLRDNLYLERAKKFDWPDLSAQERGTQFCYGLRDQLGVLADGTAVPCCLDHEGDIALGNLFTQPLSEILQSERACVLREGFSRRRPSEELCRRCGFAARF